MNIIFSLLENFIQEEQFNVLLILFVNILMNIVESIGFSFAIANIINSIENNEKKQLFIFLQIFIGFSILYILFNYLYKYYQAKISAKLRQWLKYHLIRLVFFFNNENLSSMNFIKLNSPIVRISTMCFMMVNDTITYLIPMLTFLLILFFYFLYLSPFLSAIFLIGNVFLFFFFLFNLDDILFHNRKYEENVTNNESYAIELLSNIDQIIYRGESNRELKEYETRNNNCINTAVSFYTNMNFYGFILNIILYITLFSCIFYAIRMNFNKEITIPLFISVLSVLLFYRDKMQTIIQQYPDFIEFLGRMNSVLKIFKNMENSLNTNQNNGNNIELSFQKIRFENITFRYKKEETPIFEKKSLEFQINNNNIIGIMGPSGCGKSTLMKLILKLYKIEEGDIYIDDVLINDIDSEYIRKHISYVNQNSKLFDKNVMENIYYGCPDYQSCRRHYDEIMKYDKIRELFSDINFETKESGSGGANLSGGQRQIINIINGLIRPCEILILDEPTNALDGELKRDLLNLISDFKKYKKGIIIITHDDEIRPLLDQVIYI